MATNRRWLAWIRVAPVLALASSLLSAAPIHAQTPSCQFVLGFKALHDMDPGDVGGCVDNQSLAASSGDQQQHTTNGLLVWRKADNWTAFTNGYLTWINGPSGLAQRLNTQRFSWEANPEGLPLADAPVAAPASPAQSSSPAPAPARSTSVAASPAPAPASASPAAASSPAGSGSSGYNYDTSYGY
jgi:hypothetical protein